MHFAVKRSVGILSSVTSSPRAESVFILVAVVLELIPPTGMNTQAARASHRVTTGLCGTTVMKEQGGVCESTLGQDDL